VSSPNALRWDGEPGHYEVYYLTLTDATGTGAWIRYSMLAPLPGSGRQAICSLWLVVTDPRATPTRKLARRVDFGIERLRSQPEPFELYVAEARLTDREMVGGFEDVAWALRWASPPTRHRHDSPLLRRLGAARSELALPHPDLAIEGQLTVGSRRLELSGARGQQAHLWGTKHAPGWAWVHCADFTSPEGQARPGCWIDAVSVMLGGRGQGTPVLARIDGRELRSASPWRVLSNFSVFSLTGWRFEAAGGRMKVVGEVDADRDQLAGVVYHDPDGELTHCYNSQTASMRMHLYERAPRGGGWRHAAELTAPGRAHFEYAQRAPVADLELMLS
jgi:hypothetical protein